MGDQRALSPGRRQTEIKFRRGGQRNGRPVGTGALPREEGNLGKQVSNFKAQTAVPQRSREGRGQAGRVGREKFCWSHFGWAQGVQGKVWMSRWQLRGGCPGGERELAERLELWPNPRVRI